MKIDWAEPQPDTRQVTLTVSRDQLLHMMAALGPSHEAERGLYFAQYDYKLHEPDNDSGFIFYEALRNWCTKYYKEGL